MKLWKRIAWLFSVVVLTSGCGVNQRSASFPASIQSIEQFSSDTKSTLLGAISDLNDEIKTAFLNGSESDGAYQIEIRLVDPWPDAPSRAGYATVEADHCLVELSKRIFENSMKDYAKPVIWHELGHCAGLKHDPKQGEIMYMSSVAMEEYKPDALQRFFEQVRKSAGI